MLNKRLVRADLVLHRPRFGHHNFGISSCGRVAGFNLMTNIIPKGFWPQKQSATSRSAAFLNRAL